MESPTRGTSTKEQATTYGSLKIITAPIDEPWTCTC